MDSNVTKDATMTQEEIEDFNYIGGMVLTILAIFWLLPTLGHWITISCLGPHAGLNDDGTQVTLLTVLQSQWYVIKYPFSHLHLR
jgi:hypothetical protein